ncbi:MAG: UvrD-helicase domain-containing protein [Deltaproteobacteria bacterium]|nr:UvrD-helicase domain-containing protein [Deltaproteobacteria bacterium]
MELSEQQKVAVEYIGSPALVVAGAGSGKTRTLTAKISYLIAKGYDPKRLLAITFTNKAAEEMKNRLISITGKSIDQFPWVRTYHSACLLILKKHAQLVGLSKPIQIYNTYHQQKTLKEITVKLNYDKKFVPAIASAISMAKNSGTPHDYLKSKTKLSNVIISEIYDMYQAELLEKNAVDFDDILLHTRNILKNNEDVRNYYRDLFQFILVDEYQDSNDLQEELTRLFLKGGNLFCVGDDWQSVYGFRGSNLNHFISFKEKYNDSKIFKLEENYRSADEIVQIANELIDYNEDKIDKKCFSVKSGGVVETFNLYNDSEEARWVAGKVRHLNNLGIYYNDIAIIYRTKALSLGFEKIFRAYGIPYKMMGSKGFFDRMEILDINCYLASAVFPTDDVSFDRIINTPKRGIGPSMLKKIGATRTGDMSLQDAARKVLKERVLSPKVHEKLKTLLEGLDAVRDLRPDEAVKEILHKFQYLEYLKDKAKGNEMEYTLRKENIDELIYAASDKDTIEEFLEEAALIREDKDDEEENTRNAVSLSTVHASKGLEYKAVFIVGCEEDIFPHWRSTESSSELQEERRLMYVAVTRAETHLYITSSSFRRGKPAQKSRFLHEIAEAQMF